MGAFHMSSFAGCDQADILTYVVFTINLETQFSYRNKHPDKRIGHNYTRNFIIDNFIATTQYI